jgi:hypothetical protein
MSVLTCQNYYTTDEISKETQSAINACNANIEIIAERDDEIDELYAENKELKTEISAYEEEQDEYIDELFRELNVDDIDDIVPTIKKLNIVGLQLIKIVNLESLIGTQTECDIQKILNDEEEDEEVCEHIHDCGCGKPSCMEMDGEECDDFICSNEACRHYYDHRNDNCDCGGRECPYCKCR